MNHYRKAMLFCSVALVAFAGTSCSSTQSSSAPQSENSSSSSLDYTLYPDVKAKFDEETMKIVLPLDTYIKSPIEGVITLDANILQNNECVKSKGQPSMHHLGPIPVKPDFDFGVWNKDFASKYGYATGDSKGLKEIDVATSLPEGQDTPEQMNIYNQCVSENQQLSDFPSGLPQEGTEVKAAYDESMASWQNDTDVKKWHTEWEKCLNSKGIKVPEESYWSPEIPGDLEQEIETALKDIDCKESTGYFSKSMDRLAQYQQAAIEPRKTKLDEYRKGLDAEIEQAKSILNKYGEPVPTW